MFNPIEMRRRMVQERIEKSFDNEIEKAKHQVGEVHPNGKWIWTEYAPGKFDWKSKKGKYYKNGGSNAAVPSKTPEDSGYAERFKKNFKDASDDVLNKVISGKIQGTDRDKRLAKEILDERKRSAEGEKYAEKIIDLLKVSSNKYSDIKKVTAFKTDKGNWAIDYDGANTGIILNGSKLSEKGLKSAGVKIEGGSSKGNEMKLSDFKGDRKRIVAKALDRAKRADEKDDKVKKWEYEFSKDVLRYLNEDVKYGTIKDRYGEEAEKVAKKVLAKRKKERKDFIDSAPHDFTEEQVQTYLSKYNLQSEPSATVKNTWNTLMGRIGNTSATISVGKGKFKEFSTYNAPDWRPIGDYHYSTMGWDGKYFDINGTIQSWDDVKSALSETENMTIHIYKHPKQ